MTRPDLPAAFRALDDAAIACPLPDLGSLRFDGPDAATFLQAQLASDVRTLSPGSVQRSSYQSAKGRVIADLVLFAAAEGGGIGALIAADLAAATAKRLSMFVLRAKAKVSDTADAFARLGVAGPYAREAVRAALGRAPAAGEALAQDDATLVGLPDGRIVVEVARARADAALGALGVHALRADPALWRVAQVRAGVPLVTGATSDQFVPQALNLDALGAVNFQKGCYPGQEIVARTQYLGRLKERLFALRVDADEPAAGTRLYAATFGDQPCGTVVNAAPAPGDAPRADVLAVVQLAATAGEPLHLGAPGGPVATLLSLPYPIPAPVQPRGRLA